MPGRLTGALCGVIAGAVAMGVAQLLAGVSIPQSSPVIAVGQAAIGLTPGPVEHWATATFGTDDKTVLLTGVWVVLFGYAAVIGVLAVRRLWAGMAGIAVFAAIGMAAALTRVHATAGYAWPTIGGALVAAFALYRLVMTAREAALSSAAAAAPLPPIVFGGGTRAAGGPGLGLLAGRGLALASAWTMSCAPLTCLVRCAHPARPLGSPPACLARCARLPCREATFPRCG